MNKFKVGDLVKVIGEVVIEDRKYIGKISKVTQVTRAGNYIDGVGFFFFDSQLELAKPEPKTQIIKLSQTKIIFNPPYTIVTDGTHTGKSKCNPNDTYDPIEGLRIASERFEEAKKPKPHIADLKVGALVEITGGWYHKFKIGDIGVITKMRNVTANSCEIKVGTLEQSIEIEDFKLVEKLKVGDRVEMIKEEGYSFDEIGMRGTVTNIAETYIEVKIDGVNSYCYSGDWGYQITSHCWKKICTR